LIFNRKVLDQGLGKIITWQLENNGSIELLSPEAASLDDVTRQLPPGVYTTFRTYHKTKVLHLEEHFNRLEESATLLGKRIQISRPVIRESIRAAILLQHDQPHRIRINVDLQDKPGRLYIILEPLVVLPSKAYRDGVQVIFSHLHRENPTAKSTAFVQKADEERKRLLDGVNEAIMVEPDGNILEGLSSNFFGIQKNALFTAEEGVLKGITRSQVLRCAESAGIQVVKKPVNVKDLPLLTEAFITSASRGVLPVVQIETTRIGNGKPGQNTRAIENLFTQMIEREIEEI